MNEVRPGPSSRGCSDLDQARDGQEGAELNTAHCRGVTNDGSQFRTGSLSL